MKISKNDETLYLLKRWEDNKIIIQVFAWVFLIHSFFLLLINYVYNVIYTPILYFAFYGLYIPIPLATLILSYIGPYRHVWTRRLWYVLLSIQSCMVATMIIIRSILCIEGLESAESCDITNRPIATSDVSLTYVLLGPFLILTIMRNSIKYEIPAILIIIFLTFFIIIYSMDTTFDLVTAFALIFITGAQVMGVTVAWRNDRISRESFLAQKIVDELNSNLKKEISEKNRAEGRALEEENKRTMFTSILFHEMRVPLNAVLLSINDLDSDDSFKNQLNKEASDNLERIETGLNSIVTILNDSLDYRKLTDGKLQLVSQPLDYHKMVNNVLWSMESGIKEKEISLTVDLDPALDNIPFYLLGDENRLRQVLQNYISNAIKFTGSKGHIRVQTRVQDLESDKVVLYTLVKDNGVGISTEEQSKLFQPYYQSAAGKKQGNKGTGLGLSIVASIVKSMDGTYGVESKLGEGSNFWYRITFPISGVSKVDLPPSQSRPSVPEASDPESMNRKLRILITDDDQPTRRILKRILEKLGHTVDEASDGVECISLMEKNAGQYDVLFIDNQMPRMDGLEAISILRKKGYQLYIISLTGSSETIEMSLLKQAGANVVLLKPATRNDITKVLLSVPFET